MKTFVWILPYLLISAAFAQIDPIDKNGLAIGGYDPVNYQTTGQATKGNPQLVSTHNGVKYHFTSQVNQKAFEENPSRYVPQYEGYCALAVSYGKKISVDPKTFKVVDGKLYLFFHGKSGGRTVNSLDAWNKNEPRLLKKADELWPDVKKKTYKPEETLN